MGERMQVIRDRIKRKVIDKMQTADRLQTPMTNLLGMLGAYKLLPAKLTALELFGMHGLWHTRDYVKRCEYLEFYEVNPYYAAFASRTLPNTNVVVADSIDAVKGGKLKKEKYNFIVIDNPYTGVYGNGYTEHFDLFPAVLNYIDNGILILNFIPVDPGFKSEQALRREKFYGKAEPTIDEAVAVYMKHFAAAQLQCTRHFYTFRSKGLGYLTFILKK